MHHRLFWVLASIVKPLGLQVGAILAVLDSQDFPQSLRSPIFWEHVSKMLVKGSKNVPGSPRRRFLEDFRWIWDLFSLVFGCGSNMIIVIMYSYFSLKTKCITKSLKSRCYSFTDAGNLLFFVFGMFGNQTRPYVRSPDIILWTC